MGATHYMGATFRMLNCENTVPGTNFHIYPLNSGTRWRAPLFPIPPAEAGSIDFGPLVALWVLVAAIRLLIVSGRIAGTTGASS
jgi:hypothetical protein